MFQVWKLGDSREMLQYSCEIKKLPVSQPKKSCVFVDPSRIKKFFSRKKNTLHKEREKLT